MLQEWANLFLTGKNALTIMVSILINKDVFKSSYNELKFTVWNCNYICTNLTVSESMYSYCGEAMTSLCTGHISPLLSYSRSLLPYPLSLWPHQIPSSLSDHRQHINVLFSSHSWFHTYFMVLPNFFLTLYSKFKRFYVCVLSCSVVSDSLQPHGLWPSGLLCP